MKHFILALILSFALTGTALADDGGSYKVPTQECGTYEWHGEDDLTKGRTDGIIYRVDHTEGCARVILTNLSPAGIGESQGNAGQKARATRYGQEDAARTFFNVFGIKVDEASIKVTTTNWTGGD